MKKRMTQQQEFEIMKIVLDKFLWLGMIVMLFGGYVMVTGPKDSILAGLGYIVAGAVVLILFMALILKEYEVLK